MPAKIFIADDSSTIRGVAESLLRQKGYEVYSAPDKSSAITLINETKPDLILLDSSTPEPDGLSICKTLRKNDQFLQVPIVILAGTEEAESIANSPDHGETETMMKPFTPRELNETVEKLISRASSQEERKGAEPQELEDFSSDTTDADDERLPWETTSLHLEGIQDPQRNEDKTKNIDSTTESGLREIGASEDEDDALDFTWSDLSLDTEELKKECPPSPESDTEEVVEKTGTDNSESTEGEQPEAQETAGDDPHDYDWFINEMRKETGETSTEGEHLTIEEDPAQKEQVDTAEPKASEKYEEFFSEFKADVQEFDDETEMKPIERVQPESEAQEATDARIEEIEEELAEKVDGSEADDRISAESESEEPIQEMQDDLERVDSDNEIQEEAKPQPASEESVKETQEASIEEVDKAKRVFVEEFARSFASQLAITLADNLAEHIASRLNSEDFRRIFQQSLENWEESGSES